MKTPEELCKEWSKLNVDIATNAFCYGAINISFVAGYHAGTPKWIPVEESLPEPGQVVFMYVNYELNGQRITNVEYGYYDKGTWRGGLTAYSHGFVTHWIPLPKPPEEV